MARDSIWTRTRIAERQYAIKLRTVARHIEELIKEFNPQAYHQMVIALEQYSRILRPWAETVGERMVLEVANRDRKAWVSTAKEIGRALHQEISYAPTGKAMREAVENQVELITSLPTEAAKRIQRVAINGVSDGLRADDIAKEIYATGHVTRSRADTIARTEVGRVSTNLTMARAQYVGCTHFIWRTAKDQQVRRTHRALEGKAFEWNSPPECDPGHHALPGAIWNCRCYAEPVIK